MCVWLELLSDVPTYKQFREAFGNNAIKENTYRRYITKRIPEFNNRDVEEIKRKLGITFAPIIHNSTDF